MGVLIKYAAADIKTVLYYEDMSLEIDASLVELEPAYGRSWLPFLGAVPAVKGTVPDFTAFSFTFIDLLNRGQPREKPGQSPRNYFTRATIPPAISLLNSATSLLSALISAA